MKIIKYTSTYLKKHPFQMAVFFFLNITIWAISISLPYITGAFIDKLLMNNAINYLYKFASLILVANIANVIFQYLSDYISNKLQNTIGFEAKFNLFKEIKKFPMSYFKNKDVVYLNQQINEDVTQIFSFIFNNSVPIITNILTVIICTVILSAINITLMFILILLIPLYIMLYYVFKKPLFKSNYEMREERNNYQAYQTTQFLNIKYIKTNALFAEMDKELKNRFSSLFKTIMRFFHLGYFFSNAGAIIMLIANVIIVFYGGYKVIDHTITIGQFTIINTYFSMLIGTASYFLSLGSVYQQTMVSYNRLMNIENVEAEKNGEKYFSDIDSIELKNLVFSYEEKTVINSFSYRFEKGNAYILKGSNGIGKTTLTNLIIGLYQNFERGSIQYNGEDISCLDMYSIRHNTISVLEQDIVLLGSNIYNSLTLGIENVTEQEVSYWCNTWGVGKVIEDLPLKYYTSLNEHNICFSGGEIQKLSLARCFLKKSSVFILDEPTSAFDSDSLSAFAGLINEFKKDRIIIMITHDTSLINKIDGKIIEMYA